MFRLLRVGLNVPSMCLLSDLAWCFFCIHVSWVLSYAICSSVFSHLSFSFFSLFSISCLYRVLFSVPCIFSFFFSFSGSSLFCVCFSFSLLLIFSFPLSKFFFSILCSLLFFSFVYLLFLYLISSLFCVRFSFPLSFILSFSVIVMFLFPLFVLFSCFIFFFHFPLC